MTLKELIFSILFLVIGGLTMVHAQESTNTSGGNAAGTNGSVSYSIGQVVYKIHTSENNSIAEGIQQPYETLVITALREVENLSVSAYPNPTNDLLILELKEELRDLNFELCDLQGKIMSMGKITDSRTHIATDNLSPGSYILRVLQGNKEFKTFKIIRK